MNYNIIINRTCHQWQTTERLTEVQEAEEVLKLDVKRHLDKIRNLSKEINITRPKPIEIHYVPELTNLSLHESGERMKKAFEIVMKHPVKAIGETIDTALGFFDNIFQHPLKIILMVGLTIILLVVATAMIRKGCKWHRNKSEFDQAYDMLAKIGKTRYMTNL